ncbi:MAG TPA: hypothetical protein VFT74_13385, partial [Isosphaeraceae bacterium]|nr:hypothetical protein [Isosphaeraceae bacterium]
VKTLTETSGYCRRAVQLALGRLKEMGYLDEKPAENPTGRVLVLLWRQGAQTPTPRAQAPYSQGLPRGANPVRSKERQVSEGRKGVSAPPSQIPETPLPASPRALEPRPTQAEKTETLRDWLEAVPVGSPLARLLAGRLKA